MLNRLLLLMLFFSSLSFADGIKINETLSIANVNNNIKMYKDNNGSLEPKDIINANTSGLKEEALDSLLSINKGTYWFRIDVENVCDKQLEWVFTIPRANTSGFLYFIHGNGKEEKAAFSDSYMFLGHPSIAYMATSYPKEIGILIFKISLEEGWFIFPQFDIVDKKLFLEKTIAATMIKGVTFGAAIVLFAYNLFIFFSLRTRVYGWYCVYMLMAVLFLLGNSGIGYQFLWKGSNFISKNIFTITYPLMFIAALQFSKEFLKTKERFLFINKVLNIFSILFLLLFIVFMTEFKIDAAKIFSISSLAMSFLPLLGLYSWQKGYKEARFYTFAWGVWAIGMLPLMLLLLGAQISYDTVTFGARVGLILESILLSFALADQINILRNQKDEAEKKYESQRILLELNSRQAQMGDMVSAIAHQWKQPLNLIMIMLKGIEITAAGNGSKVSQELAPELNHIKSVVSSMSSTMDDFKNFFSPSKRKTVFSPILMVQNILSMFGKQYDDAKIAFEIDGNDKLTVTGKENELKQVILNIFNNARDAFCSNGIETRKIWIKVENTDRLLTIRIKDNAGGIPNDILEKVFEQYYTTKGDDGTGLGLYICKKIVEESFYGKINVKNEDGGAIFTIELPQNNF